MKGFIIPDFMYDLDADKIYIDRNTNSYIIFKNFGRFKRIPELWY